MGIPSQNLLKGARYQIGENKTCTARNCESVKDDSYAEERMRAVIASRGRTELGLSSAERARHLEVAASSTSRLIEKMGKK